MDTEDGQIFIRVRLADWQTISASADNRAELGLLCSNTRKGSRKCPTAAAAGLKRWATCYRLPDIAHGPIEPAVFLVERVGSGPITAVSDFYVTSNQAREAYIDTTSHVLPAVSFRRPGHTCWSYERATGEHTYRCLSHKLRFVPQQCAAEQAEVV